MYEHVNTQGLPETKGFWVFGRIMVSSQLYTLYQFHCGAGRASPYGVRD